MVNANKDDSNVWGLGRIPREWYLHRYVLLGEKVALRHTFKSWTGRVQSSLVSLPGVRMSELN
jgi:hypothetical protein